jgi:hypothetical protein
MRPARVALFVGSVAAASLATRGADAQEAPPPAAAQAAAPAEREPQLQPLRRAQIWYGWQTLFVDGAGIGMAIAGLATGSTPVNTAGAVTYLFGPPIVHWVHGHGGKGVIDLGLRFLLPLVGFGVGALFGLTAGKNSEGVYDGAAVGGLIVGTLGVGAAVTIDAALVAYDTRLEESDPSASKRPGIFALPRLELRQGGVTLGASGTF